MNAFALHDTSDQAGVLRWGISAAAIVAVHTGLIALGLAWYTQRPPPGVTMPAIMVDMAPASSAPRPTPMDLAPGPQMQQADVSPPPESTTQEPVEEQIAPTPPIAAAGVNDTGAGRGTDRADAAQAGTD